MTSFFARLYDYFAPKKTDYEILKDTEGSDALVSKIWEDLLDKKLLKELGKRDYGIECLAFEGGGVKGAAYAGACKVLEEIGLLSKVKRFAGTSAGSYIAMQLAIGMPVDEIVKFNGLPNLQESFFDSSYWFLPINILRRYGWHSGDKMTQKIEDDLEKYLGSRDATFYDLYEKRGVELCVVITDLNVRNAEYLHPKTVPNGRIADAVKTSMSLPFIYTPSSRTEIDTLRLFVDGGVLQNYPIQVFDGWYLSMKPEDLFFARITDDVAYRFHGYNDKVLGMSVFAYGESEAFADDFLNRYGPGLLDGRPETKLSQEREYTREWAHLSETAKTKLENSSREILRYLAHKLQSKADKKGLFTPEEFKEVIDEMKQNDIMREHLLCLCQDGICLEDAFEDMDINKDNKLSLLECLTYLRDRGIYLRYNLRSKYPKKIENMVSYLISITDTMSNYISELQSKDEDIKRTIGIYTDYINTIDFDITIDDKVYLLNQGVKAAINYLKNIDEIRQK